MSWLRNILLAGGPGSGRYPVGSSEDAAPKMTPRAKVLVKSLVAYHGTASDVLKSLETNGLEPHGSAGADEYSKTHPEAIGNEKPLSDADFHRKPSVYITTNPGTAAMFATYASKVHPGSTPMITRWKLPATITKNLRPDEAMHVPYVARYEGTIAPKYLDAWRTPSDSSWHTVKHAAMAAASSGRMIYVLHICDNQQSSPVQAGWSGSGRYPKGSQQKSVTLLERLLSGGPGSGRYPKGSGGKTHEPAGRIFVSPNVEEGTVYDQAKKALASDRQKTFESKASEVASTVIDGGVQVKPALGVWADGAENSTDVEVSKGTAAQQEYAASLLGKTADQKAVLNWRLNANGPNTLHTLTTSDSADTLNSKLEKAGIEFRTVEPSADGKTSSAHIFDENNSMGNDIDKFSEANGYDHKENKGKGEFIGSWDSRREGLQEYNKRIGAYERGNPGRAYRGKLFSMGERGTEGVHAGGVRSGAPRPYIRRNRGIQTPDRENVQARLALMMENGMYRVSGGVEPALVTRKYGLAEATALRRSSHDTVVYVYDNRGEVVFASGGGQALHQLDAGGPGSGRYPAGSGAGVAPGKSVESGTSVDFSALAKKYPEGGNLDSEVSNWAATGVPKGIFAEAFAASGLTSTVMAKASFEMSDWIGSASPEMRKRISAAVNGTPGAEKGLSILYQVAQAQLKAQFGTAKTVTLYRGLMSQNGITNPVMQQLSTAVKNKTPFSLVSKGGADSWTDAKSTAEDFAEPRMTGDVGYVLERQIPLNRVFSTYKSNTMLPEAEHEYIVAPEHGNYGPVKTDQVNQFYAEAGMTISLDGLDANWLHAKRIHGTSWHQTDELDGTPEAVAKLMESRSFGPGGKNIWQRGKDDRVITVAYGTDGLVKTATLYNKEMSDGQTDVRKGWKGLQQLASAYGD
jgi:hypothetical protein